MRKQTAMQASTDFVLARTHTIFRDFVAILSGTPNRLLEFHQVSQLLRIGGPIYRGLRLVRLSDIIGSVQRYEDFDSAFLPRQSISLARWARINRAWYDDVSLPPVSLYMVGQAHFAVDGHHRISVARARGAEYIEAEVRECHVRIPVTASLRAEHLEILGAKVQFMERTNLDQLRPKLEIDITILGGYDRLLEHIAVHRYFMGLDYMREISEAEAVIHWLDNVYHPTIDAINKGGIAPIVSGRSPADFYLWLMDHKHYLHSNETADFAFPNSPAL